jgi:steroid 5-alpha reductase family enzyme
VFEKEIKMPSSIYLINLLAVVCMMVTGWVFSVRKQNVTIVDSLWGLGFVLIAWLTWFQLDGMGGRSLLITVLTTLWGVRLALYLTWRNYGKGEDPRYAQWRKAGGERFWITSLFKVFLLQAIFLWAIALVIQAGQAGSGSERLGWLDLAGTLIWLTGFVFEAVGDWQLARFKANPANRGQVMDQGLWRYTRHPNYFGESLIWWGLFVIALSHPANWWTVVSPVIITSVLLKMTGIPLTEKLLVEKRPGYRDYVRNTSAFFPWAPKKTSNETESYHENTDPIG